MGCCNTRNLRLCVLKTTFNQLQVTDLVSYLMQAKSWKLHLFRLQWEPLVGQFASAAPIFTVPLPRSFLYNFLSIVISLQWRKWTAESQAAQYFMQVCLPWKVFKLLIPDTVNDSRPYGTGAHVGVSRVGRQTIQLLYFSRWVYSIGFRFIQCEFLGAFPFCRQFRPWKTSVSEMLLIVNIFAFKV